MLSSVTRMIALTTLGQLYARRGNQEAEATLDEAAALAERTGKLVRISPVCAARAELALLDGDHRRALEEAGAVREAVFSRGNRWDRGELAWLLWQAGDRDVPTEGIAAPYAMQIAGDVAAAAEAWREIGCPYEEACVLAASDDPSTVQCAAAIFEGLGAQPALGRVIQRLQALGVCDLPPVRRGPPAATRGNAAVRPAAAPASAGLAARHRLTGREVEVLRLLTHRRTDREIADELFISPKTAGFHVANILGKLGVANRRDAATLALREGLTVHPS
jgi:DNA-binding NarL/FixJ family response regulator